MNLKANQEQFSKYIHNKVLDAQKIDMEKWFLRFVGLLGVVVMTALTILVVVILIGFARVGILTKFEVRDQFMQECLESESYTRQECITLAGDNGD
jgi:hypothetical protein